MNICIPVDADQGLASRVCHHFGSAPAFLLVDTQAGTTRCVPNANLHHAHGQCQPLLSLQGEHLDGIVVGGIGRGALQRLIVAGLQVYQTDHPSVEATLAALAAGELRPMTPDAACGGRHGHGHSHDHQRSSEPRGQGPHGHVCRGE